MWLKKYSLYVLVLILCSCGQEKELNSYIAFGDSHINKFDFEYHFPGHQINNQGINGLTIEEVELVIHNYSSIGLERIIIHAGTNDQIKAINNEIDEALFIDQMTTKINNLIVSLNVNQAIIIGSLPLTEAYIEDRLKYDFDKVEQIWKEAVAGKTQFKYISTSTLWDQNNLLDPSFSTDLIHLNELGYTTISARIYEEMD